MSDYLQVRILTKDAETVRHLLQPHIDGIEFMRFDERGFKTIIKIRFSFMCCDLTKREADEVLDKYKF